MESSLEQAYARLEERLKGEQERIDKRYTPNAPSRLLQPPEIEGAHNRSVPEGVATSEKPTAPAEAHPTEAYARQGSPSHPKPRLPRPLPRPGEYPDKCPHMLCHGAVTGWGTIVIWSQPLWHGLLTMPRS